MTEPAVNLSETGTGMEAPSVTVTIVQNHWATWNFLNLNLFLLEGNHTNALRENMIDGQAPCINKEVHIFKRTATNHALNPFINHSPGMTKRMIGWTKTCPQKVGNHRSWSIDTLKKNNWWWSYWNWASSTSMIVQHRVLFASGWLMIDNQRANDD